MREDKNKRWNHMRFCVGVYRTHRRRKREYKNNVGIIWYVGLVCIGPIDEAKWEYKKKLRSSGVFRLCAKLSTKHSEMYHFLVQCLSCVPHFSTMDVGSTEVFVQRTHQTCGLGNVQLVPFAVPSSGNGMVDPDLFTKTRYRCPVRGREQVVKVCYHTQVISGSAETHREEDHDAPRRKAQPERDARKNKLRERVAPGLGC